MSLNLLAPEVGQFMLIVTGLTMVVTPFIAAAARRLAAVMERESAVRAHEGDLANMGELEGHVIIAAFGRVGRTIAEVLEAQALPYVALDTDPVLVARARQKNLPVYYGDASRLEMLKRAHIDRAQGIVITIDTASAAEDIIRQIRRTWPAIPVYARARDLAHAERLTAAGATVAVPETVEASLQLAGRVLAGGGTVEEVVRRRLEQQRARELGYA
jgi:CPA2 family monovalent cation:H+ antiporter-2